MRQLIQKLGRIKTVIVITLFSVLASISITYLAFYLRNDDPSAYLSISLATTITLSLATIIPLIVAPLTSWSLVGVFIQIDNLEKEMRELATFDSLTDLLSRRAFFHDANSFIHFSEREQSSFSVIALDLDNFKNINDSFGHSAGDKVLKHFATSTKTILRRGDLIGRIGGDEFALLLSNTSEEAAFTFSERLHQTVRETVIIHDKSSIKYTISMGLISLVPNKTDTIETLLKKADQSLYLAKEKGRNCTVTFNNSKEN